MCVVDMSGINGTLLFDNWSLMEIGISEGLLNLIILKNILFIYLIVNNDSNLLNLTLFLAFLVL